MTDMKGLFVLCDTYFSNFLPIFAEFQIFRSDEHRLALEMLRRHGMWFDKKNFEPFNPNFYSAWR